ncbi:hypothetical protein GCM10028819_33530 [Spirosoma humi]
MKIVSFRNLLSRARGNLDQYAQAVLYLPLAIGIITLFVFFFRLWEVDSIIVSYTRIDPDELPKPLEMAINLTIELNKYVISIGTGLFGLVGFFFKDYAAKLTVRSINMAFLLALLLLGLGGLYAFTIYTELTNSLSQGVYALNPGNSRILAYIELEFILCLGASLSLGSIFVAFQISRPVTER